jgi:hypothetical protein
VREAITGHDVATSEGGRGYVAEFFAKRLRRHDFSRYIAERLAADFACALAEYLSKHDAALASGAAVQEPVAWTHEDDPRECISDLKKRDMIEYNGVPGRRAAEKYSIPSYAAPVPRQAEVALTDEQIRSLKYVIARLEVASVEAECEHARNLSALLAASTPATTAGALDEREAFETSFKAWTGKSISYDRITDDEGDERYVDSWLQGAWIGWQARAASSSPTADSQGGTIPVELSGVAETLANGDGFWRSCSGCHETEDGHPVGDYPYSDILKCDLGGGCSECGGIGAVWDDTDYEAMGRDFERELAASSAPSTSAGEGES